MQTADDGTFLQVNETFCSWVGYSRAELVGRKRFVDLLSMGGRIFHQTHWAPLLGIQGSVSEVKLDVVRRDGSTIPVVFNAIRREQEGRFVLDLAAFVARDRDTYERELIASRRRLEVLVANATRLEAEAKDRALFAEQMVGIVSHDLRNPLASIFMGARLLERESMTPEQSQILMRVSRSAERASRLIDDLLDFTQVRLGGALPVSPHPIELHESVAEAVGDLAIAHPKRVIEHIRTGQGPCMADANRLAQMIGNLVANALAYGTPELPVTITSSIDEATFSVSVHNDGEPIPEAAQAGLFEPMTRGGKPSASGRSVGLGLFIVREIAKAHRGTASVTSTATDGTTFVAVFPR